jgi:hypothetical protein
MYLSIVQITDPSPTRAVVVKGSIPSYSPAHYNSSSSANNSNNMAHYTATTTSSARRYSPASSPRHIARNSREFTIVHVKNPPEYNSAFLLVAIVQAFYCLK